MSLNPTIDYLMAKKSISLLLFARQLTNITVMLYGPGQLDAVGVPIPCNGTLRRLTIYDSESIHNITEDVPVKAGDLLNVQAEFSSTSFTITALLNQTATALAVDGINGYRTVWASILIELVDPTVG